MDIPSNVLAAVKAAPTLDLFPVTDTELFSGQVLKTRVLQFDSGAVLHVTRALSRQGNSGRAGETCCRQQRIFHHMAAMV